MCSEALPAGSPATLRAGLSFLRAAPPHPSVRRHFLVVRTHGEKLPPRCLSARRSAAKKMTVAKDAKPAQATPKISKDITELIGEHRQHA